MTGQGGNRGEDAVMGFRVTGRVQGVGFRWWTQRQAQRLGLRGYVANRPDGSVEVQAAGTAHALAQLKHLLQRGPSGAQVSEVASLPAADGALPDPFGIR